MSGDKKKERVIMKKTLAVLMALTMAASMAGCNAGSQPAAGDAGAKTEAASSVQEKSGTEDKGGSGTEGQARIHGPWEPKRKLQNLTGCIPWHTTAGDYEEHRICNRKR